MKKILTLAAVFASALMLNAATDTSSVTWLASDLDLANNAALDGVSAQINSNLSISFANDEATENNYIRYRDVTAMPEPAIGFYSKNVITISATNAMITSVVFNILLDEGAGNDYTPNWKFSANGTTLSGNDNTWSGSTAELVLTGGSKASITGMTIEYIPSNPTVPGEETNFTWMATQITDLANSEEMDGMSFDINDVISFSLANAGGAKPIIFKKGSGVPTSINLYSNNTITFTAAEGTTINSIQFLVNTSVGTSTPEWILQDDSKNSYSADNDTWSGSASELTFTDKSSVYLTGFTITYVTEGNGDGEGGEEEGGEEGGDYKQANLFFTEEMVGTGESVQNVTLSNNGTSLVFTTTSTSAKIDDNNAYYGSADDFETIQYRYGPGGNSSKGIDSPTKGVFTFPCDGTLYIYAFNGQDQARNLQIIQDGTAIFDHTYNSDDYETPEGRNIKVYPIIDTKVSEGTAYLLWPVNQVTLSGFVFEPGQPSGVDTVEVSAGEIETPAFDLFGRRVGDDYRGIYIKNGKKYVRR